MGDKSCWQKIDTAISVLMRKREVNIAVLLGEARDEIIEAFYKMYDLEIHYSDKSGWHTLCGKETSGSGVLLTNFLKKITCEKCLKKLTEVKPNSFHD